MAGRGKVSFLLAAFILMSVSCMTWRTKEVDSGSRPPGDGVKIRSLVTTSGERIEFSRSGPGRIMGGVIRGTAFARLAVPISIQGPFSSIRRRPDGSVYEITDGNGRVHLVGRVLKEGDTQWDILVNDRTVQPVSIPLSDVRQIWYKKIDPFTTMIVIAIPLAMARFFLWMHLSEI